MLKTITSLLAFQLIGEATVFAFSLPVPGPVIGMSLLFVALLIKGSVDQEIRHSVQGLLQHLPLLFVPAGVGVMLHIERLEEEWLPLTVSLVGSTIVALLVTAGVMSLLIRKNREQA